MIASIASDPDVVSRRSKGRSGGPFVAAGEGVGVAGVLSGGSGVTEDRDLVAA